MEDFFSEYRQKMGYFFPSLLWSPLYQLHILCLITTSWGDSKTSKFSLLNLVRTSFKCPPCEHFRGLHHLPPLLDLELKVQNAYVCVCVWGGPLHTPHFFLGSTSLEVVGLRNRRERWMEVQKHHCFPCPGDPSLLVAHGCISGLHLLTLQTSRHCARHCVKSPRRLFTEFWGSSIPHGFLKRRSSSSSTPLHPTTPPTTS